MALTQDAQRLRLASCKGLRPREYVILVLCLVIGSCNQQKGIDQVSDPWAKMDTILAAIHIPEFPDRSYNISDFGASANATTDDLPAFTNAIKACHESGGGKVVVGAGTYVLNGPIHMLSNVHLAFSEGAVIKFSNNPTDYLPVVHTRWEGVELYNYSALIYAYKQENIAITGPAILDGQADEEHWWPWKGNATAGWSTGEPSQRDPSSRQRLIRYNREQTPVEQRIFGDKGLLRPNFIQPYDCKNVYIEGITLKNSPMWVIHPVLCENVIVENIKVDSHGPNNDGCNPESCRNVLIRNCEFDTGDDCIALKSGRNQDGRTIGRPIENVVVQGCRMKDGHGGVVIGSEVSGGARNIFAEDCEMDSPNLDRAIRIKTNRSRGGTIENLFFRNINVGRVAEAVVKINMLYTLDDSISISYPTVQNIFIENVKSQNSQYGVRILGISETYPVRNVVINNCSFNGVENGNDIQFIDSLVVNGVEINGEPWSYSSK